MKVQKVAALLSIIISLTGCADGGTVMLAGAKPAVARPTDEIQLLLEKPEKPFKIVALINSSSDTGWTGSVSMYETLALEKLKTQAAEAGADAVYDIQETTMDAGQVVSSVDWGRAQLGLTKKNIPTATSFSGGLGSTFKTYTFVFRAKAIKFK